MLGLRIIPGASKSGPVHSEKVDFSQISSEKKAILAVVEHNRWMAERLLLGWSYGQRSDQPPKRGSLCSKRDLPQDELEKDFEQISAIIQHFQNRGFCFGRVTTQ